MKSSENMDDVSTAIHAVKGHLSNIPHEEKSAIVHVQHVRPELVNDKHILQFLRVEKFDINVSYGVCIRPVCLQNSIELCISPILSGFDIICYTNSSYAPCITLAACNTEARTILGDSLHIFWT